MTDEIYIPLLRPKPNLSLSRGSEIRPDSVKSDYQKSPSEFLLKQAITDDKKKGLQFQRRHVDGGIQSAIDNLFNQTSMATDEFQYESVKRNGHKNKIKSAISSELFDFETCRASPFAKAPNTNKSSPSIMCKLNQGIMVRQMIADRLPGDLRLKENAKLQLVDSNIIQCIPITNKNRNEESYSATQTRQSNGVATAIIDNQGLHAIRRLRRYKIGISPDERIKIIQGNLNSYSRMYLSADSLRNSSTALEMSDEFMEVGRKLNTKVFSPVDFPNKSKEPLSLRSPLPQLQIRTGSPPLSPKSVTSDVTDTNGTGYDSVLNEYLSEKDSLMSSLTPASDELLHALAAKKPSPMIPNREGKKAAGAKLGKSQHVLVQNGVHVNEKQSKATMISLVRFEAPRIDRDKDEQRMLSSGAIEKPITEHIMLELPAPGRKASAMGGAATRLTDSPDTDFDNWSGSSRGGLITPWTALQEDPAFSHSFRPSDLPESTEPAMEFEHNDGDDDEADEDNDKRITRQKGPLIGNIGYSNKNAVIINDEVSEVSVESPVDEGEEEGGELLDSIDRNSTQSPKSHVSFADEDRGEYDEGSDGGEGGEGTSSGVCTPRIPPINTMPEIVTSPAAQFGIDPKAYGVQSPNQLSCCLCTRDATLWCQGCSQAYCPRCWGRAASHGVLGQADLWGTAKAGATIAKTALRNSSPLNVTLGPGGVLLPGVGLGDGTAYNQGRLRRSLAYPRTVTGRTQVFTASKSLDFQRETGSPAAVGTGSGLQSETLDSFLSSMPITTVSTDGQRGRFAGKGARKPKATKVDLPAAGKGIYVKPASNSTHVSRKGSSPAKSRSILLPLKFEGVEGDEYKGKPVKPVEVHAGVSVYTKLVTS